MEIPEDHVIAEGPEGLRQVLDQLLEQVTNDPVAAKKEHCILYRIGSQRSLIKVDTTHIPFTFYYYDLMGRAATTAVKDTIALFLWEKCGEEERYTKAVNK